MAAVIVLAERGQHQSDFLPCRNRVLPVVNVPLRQFSSNSSLHLQMLSDLRQLPPFPARVSSPGFGAPLRCQDNRNRNGQPLDPPPAGQSCKIGWHIRASYAVEEAQLSRRWLLRDAAMSCIGWKQHDHRLHQKRSTHRVSRPRLDAVSRREHPRDPSRTRIMVDRTAPT